jgi:hypothetical protein
LQAWVKLASFSEFPQDWDTAYVDLSLISAGPILLRLQITADATVGEDGWLVDRLTVFAGKQEYSVKNTLHTPTLFALNTYPNPFNDRLRVTIDLPVNKLATVGLYDSMGRRVIFSQSDCILRSESDIAGGLQIAFRSYFCFIRMTRGTA